MKSFYEWLELREAGMARRMRARFSELPNFTNRQVGDDGSVGPPSWMEKTEFAYDSKSQGREDMWRAFRRAQGINKHNGGRPPVYFAISEPKKYDLEDTFKYLTSRSNKEISVSVHKGVWSTYVVLEGVAKLLMYYDKDVSTNPTRKGHMIPITAFAPSGDSHYDEAVISLRDVHWTRLNVDGSDPLVLKFGGMEELANLAGRYRLQVVDANQSHPDSPIGQTFRHQEARGKVVKDT
jgi:hypothetical protein